MYVLAGVPRDSVALDGRLLCAAGDLFYSPKSVDAVHW